MDVRIGYPNECLAADTPEEINQPMYSTSIGLLLKGLEIYEQNKEELVVNKLEQDDLENSDEGEDIVKKTMKERFKGGKILEGLKNTLSDIFDESDVKM